MDELTNALADIACKQPEITGILIAYVTHKGGATTMAMGEDPLVLLGLADMAKQNVLSNLRNANTTENEDGEQE